ncbi:SpaA isopeptide-forming pilin-related protein [Enterococcus sp. DIV0800]|uniref:SpaA isopeptide-forming pilin-related protein n=1 Tax=unclassified Enterococcus TaxID=2608891 RepID=UPI003D2FF1B1
MKKKYEKLGYLFFVGMLMLPFIFQSLKAIQVYAAEKTLEISVDVPPKKVGDQGKIIIKTDNPDQTIVTVTPERGMTLTKEISDENVLTYDFQVLKVGSYQINAKNKVTNQETEDKFEIVERDEAVKQPELTGNGEVSSSTTPTNTTALKSSDSNENSRQAVETTNSSSRDEIIPKAADSKKGKNGDMEAKGAVVHPLSPDNQTKLGDLWDYNAYLTGQHSANMADTEGALAVKGDSVFPTDLQTFTYGASFRENNTTIGDPIRDDQFVNLLIGGKIDNRATSDWVKPVVENRTTNGQTQGWLVGRNSMPDWIYKNLGEWFSAVAYKADDEIIEGAFSHLQAQEDQLAGKLDQLTMKLGQVVFENSTLKLSVSADDPQVLILSVKSGQTPLEIKTLTIPDEYLNDSKYKQIIVSSMAEKVVMNGTSISGAAQQDAGTYSQLAGKLSFYFPNAKSITNYLEDDGSYPDTTKPGITGTGEDNYGKDNGKNYFHSFTIGSIIAPNATVVYHSGSINGYVFVKNLHQRDGMEIHNFYNPWLPDIEHEKNGEVVLHKQDSESKEPLVGADFGIRKKGTLNFIDVQTTGNDGNLKFSELDYGDYEITETKAPAGYELSSAIYNVTINKETPSIMLEAENNKEKITLAEIEIHKTNAVNHENLPGAVFGLRGLREHDFAKGTTNDKGITEFKNLTPGYYELVELTSPDGYQIDAHPQIIYASAHEKKVSIELTNKPKEEKKGSIQLKKIDATTGQPLKGVEFGVREFGQRNFIKKKTDDNGLVTFTDLKPGAFYTVAELTALEDYELTSHPLIVKVSENGQDVNIGNWTNQKQTIIQKGSLKIVKTDKNTGHKLANATFGIRALGQKDYQKGITDAQGEIFFAGLVQGIYEVRELKAPAGYEATNLVKKVSVGYDAQTPITISNWENEHSNLPLGSAKIVKVDQNGHPLGGAEFAIRNDHEREFSHKTESNENGEAYFNNLPLGKYEVIETKAPAGYQIDGTLHHLIVANSQTDTNTLTVKNEKKTDNLGQVVLEKKDKDTFKVLAGVVFDLEKQDGTVLQTYKTDKFGRIFVKNLTFGTYQFVEKKSLSGYELDQTPIIFTINKENFTQLLTLSVTNKHKKSTTPTTTPSTKEIMSDSGVRDYGSEVKEYSKKRSNAGNAYPQTNDSVNPWITFSGVGLLLVATYLIYRKRH